MESEDLVLKVTQSGRGDGGLGSRVCDAVQQAKE